MLLQEYRFKFYLNAIHSIEINNVMGKAHPHTWEIGIEAYKSDDSFVMFTEIEKAVEKSIAPFQDKVMNQVAPFDVINPTLENVSFYFKRKLEKLLMDHDWMMTRLEVSETPTRTFVIDLKNPSNMYELMSSKQEVIFKTVDAEAERIAQERMTIEPVQSPEHEQMEKQMPRDLTNLNIFFGVIGAIFIIMAIVIGYIISQQ